MGVRVRGPGPGPRTRQPVETLDPLATWEKVLLGVVALVVQLVFFPGVKTLMQRSQEAEKDWPAALIPLALVVLFVILLIAIV